jgi:hypothetical protein
MSDSENTDVRWHGISDLADLDLYLGPDTIEVETAVTVVSGRVSGELDRTVSRDDDGGLGVVYEARLDGLGEGTGVAKIESDSIDELTCLATVAGFLAREMAKLVGQDQLA